MSKCSATLAAASSKLIPVKIRSAPSASDISVALISCQPCSRGPAISARARISSPDPPWVAEEARPEVAVGVKDGPRVRARTRPPEVRPPR